MTDHPLSRPCAAALAAMLAWSCSTTTVPGDLELPAEVQLSSPTFADSSVVWNAPETVSDSVITEDVGVPLDLAIASDGKPVVCWTEGKIGAWRIVVAEPRAGTWLPTVVGMSSQASEPHPRLLFDSTGRLIVAWGGSDETPGGGFAVRPASGGAWPNARPIDRRCEGDIALSLSGGIVRCVFVRPVAKWDIRKLAGNFVEDPVHQDYAKLAVAVLTKAGWREERILERDNLLRCKSPELAGAQLLYHRYGSSGPEETLFVDLEKSDVAERILPTSLLESSAAFDVVEVAGRPLAAIEGKAGCIFVERQARGWSAPFIVPIGQYSIRAAADESTVHSVAVMRGTFEISYSCRRSGVWSKPVQIATGQTCVVRSFGGNPVVCWTDGWELGRHEHPRTIRVMRAK